MEDIERVLLRLNSTNDDIIDHVKQKLGAGWPVEDVISFFLLTEEINPYLDEEAALTGMAVIEKRNGQQSDESVLDACCKLLNGHLVYGTIEDYLVKPERRGWKFELKIKDETRVIHITENEMKVKDVVGEFALILQRTLT